MSYKPYQDYKFIEVLNGFVWPLHPKTDVIKAIKGPDEWKEVKKELGRFLDGMNELNYQPLKGLGSISW
jgi:hypothetical protein